MLILYFRVSLPPLPQNAQHERNQYTYFPLQYMNMCVTYRRTYKLEKNCIQQTSVLCRISDSMLLLTQQNYLKKTHYKILCHLPQVSSPLVHFQVTHCAPAFITFEILKVM
jgi:hypothetical protein